MTEIDNILEVEKYISDMDAVIFDLDDTLYPEKEYVRSGYKKIAEFFGRPELADSMWGIFKRRGKAVDEVLASSGLSGYREDALLVYRFQRPDIQLYPGVADMLERIRKSGKKTGIITDGRPEGQRAKLDVLKIKVDYIIVTDELGGVEFRKPNKVAFCQMKERLSIPFGRMVYVGDNPLKDFIAPDELGMKSIWFRNRDGIYAGTYKV